MINPVWAWSAFRALHLTASNGLATFVKILWIMRRGLLLLILASIFFSAQAQALLSIADVQIKDIRNKPFSITAHEKNVVVFFLGTDCPITQKYITRVKDIVSEFKSTTDFYGVFPSQFSLKQIKRFKKDYKMTIRFLSDDKMELAHLLGATVTPEVFLMDDGLKLQYKGAIDNWFYELGKNRLNTSERYLIDALSALANDETPLVKETEAIGCFIQMPAGMKHH